MKPLAIDLFCGLGGWSEGLLAEGYDVIGFDIERHVYGEHQYPGMLAIQDVTTLHGSQFRNAALIVASPPCQGYSYRAMPWKRAKALPPPDNTLFESCFRIQREACEAAGRHIPLIVENVRGGGSWFKVAHNTTSGHGQNPDGRLWKRDPMASAGSGSKKRKMASAMIAKIPLPLSRYIAATFRPQIAQAAE